MVKGFLKKLNRLYIKKRKSIGKKGDSYSIPIIIVIRGLQYLLKTNKVSLWSRNPYINYRV